MPRRPRWPSGSAPPWWRPMPRATASSPWPPGCWAPMWASGRGPSSTRSRTAPIPHDGPHRAGIDGSNVMVRKPLPDGMQVAIDAIGDLKANQLVVLDLRGLNDATDYFIIASGTSDAHVRGIADSVMEKMDRLGFRTHHVEGVAGGRWVLLDFVDFVVHLFHPETRAFYQLERLWSDAPRREPAAERKSP